MISNAIRVTDGSEQKLIAISMAKEWIEAVTNIRDTNWKVLPWDYKNCWNVLNYNINCFNSNGTWNDIDDGKSFYVNKNTTDFRWWLYEKPTSVYSDSDYRRDFQVWLTASWFYYQNWADTTLKPLFTREIQINYLPDGTAALTSERQKMHVKSIVIWSDSSWALLIKVVMENFLTNW
jgi:hypothetical protein